MSRKVLMLALALVVIAGTVAGSAPAKVSISPSPELICPQRVNGIVPEIDGCYYPDVLVTANPTSLLVNQGQTRIDYTIDRADPARGCYRNGEWGYVAIPVDGAGHAQGSVYRGPFGAAGTYGYDVVCNATPNPGSGHADVVVNNTGGGGGGGTCTNGSQYVTQVPPPAAMNSGDVAVVQVAMNNTGTCPWTEGGKYRLGSQNPENNTNWGLYRVYLAAGESIAPGQTKYFAFSVKAPAVTGTVPVNFQWRVVQEGVQWLGLNQAGYGLSPNVVLNVTGSPPPPPPPACSNGLDDDGDGRIDLADPGCSSSSDTNEADDPPPPPPAPVLLSGKLLDANSQPVVGTVSAFSAAMVTNVGDSASQDQIATTTTDASGQFTLTADPASPAMQAALANAASNDGWLNLDVYAISGTTMVYTGISRKLVNGQWASNNPGPPVSTEAATTMNFKMARGTPGYVALRRPARRLQASSGLCFPLSTSVVATGSAYAIVGNMHTAKNMTGWFKYGQKADTDFSVGFSADGANWSISGSSHVSNTNSAAVTWTIPQDWGHRLLSNFSFQKIKSTCFGLSGTQTTYRIKVKSWNSGALLGADVHALDNQCTTTYSAYKVAYAPRTQFERTSESAVNYSAGVTIFGITLGAKSGYSTAVVGHWDMGGKGSGTHWLCGTDGPPTRAHTVLAGG